MVLSCAGNVAKTNSHSMAKSARTSIFEPPWSAHQTRIAPHINLATRLRTCIYNARNGLHINPQFPHINTK